MWLIKGIWHSHLHKLWAGRAYHDLCRRRVGGLPSSHTNILHSPTNQHLDHNHFLQVPEIKLKSIKHRIANKISSLGLSNELFLVLCSTIGNSLYLEVKSLKETARIWKENVRVREISSWTWEGKVPFAAKDVEAAHHHALELAQA